MAVHRRIAVFVLGVALALAGCASAAPESVAEVVDDAVAGKDGGADVLLIRNGTTERYAAGNASADGTALSPGRSFRVGSISKPFVATMVLQLEEEGSIDLDASLGDHLPGASVGADRTIRQLLAHESGIANYTDQVEFVEGLMESPDRLYTPSEVVFSVALSEEGRTNRFSYSNTNYILLGQLIEHLDGTDLNTSLRTRITEPAGLNGTFFDTGDLALPEDLTGGWSAGFVQGDPADEYTAMASAAWSAGALVSSTDDLATFLTALNSGQLVSEGSLKAMTDFGNDGNGLGLFRAEFGPRGSFGHGGSIPGYSSTMTINPETGDIAVVLTNNDLINADNIAASILNIE